MKLSRMMITAAKSGSGKTIITCGMLASLKGRGIDVVSYKCGPDYIDPMFHREVLGIRGGNLDSFFSSDEEIKAMLSESCGEAAVLEGVMGIYDGMIGMSRKGSCYEVASITGTPVLLVIDVKGMGQTMLSLVKGILSDDESKLIRGIILNRISPDYFEIIGPVMDEMLKEISYKRGERVSLIGGLPDSEDIHLKSRHLGLNMPEEIEDLKAQTEAASKLIDEHLDMDEVLRIMSHAPELPNKPKEQDVCTESEPELTLAVARDGAFCFYYEENLRMLRDAGLKIKEFSPLRDKCLPDDADGFLLGGGYPELHAAELSANSSMIYSIKQAIESGMPSLAECGGFMYLMDSITDLNGNTHKMAGLIPGAAHSTGKLGRFGYVTISENEHASSDRTILSGLSICGHEFHYYDSDNNGIDGIAEKPGTGRKWECIHAGLNHAWGYPHLWYPSCPEFVAGFIESMKNYKRMRTDG